METQNTNQNNLPEQQQTTTPASEAQAAPATAPTATIPQQPVPNQQGKLTAGAEKLKRLSIQVMIGGLISAAGLAVVAVLAGSFNETFQKALFTLFLVVAHALACLAFVEQTGKTKNSSFRFFENAVFFIIVLSFFTSIFGVWGIISGDIVGKLYGTYLVLLFACLHGQMLVETRGKQKLIDNLVIANYGMMSLVILLLLPIIWLSNTDFPDVYYRLLAASGIIDGTLTVLAVILHRLYVQKHPEIQSTIFSNSVNTTAGAAAVPAGQMVEQKRRIHPLIWLLGIFIIGQFVISILFAILGAFYR